MTPELDADEQVIAEAWGDYAARRARGEPPSTLEYRERLGSSHPAFLDLVEMESLLEECLDPPGDGPFPRPFGAYTLLREVDRGAMGIVYEATHRQLGRRVALKVMRPGTEIEPGVRGRFHDEPRAGAQVSHPNVVEIYDVGVAEGRPYFAMKFVDGRPLSVRIARAGAGDARAVARAVAGVADGLAALHARGVIHRDIKPSNILCADDGTWILTDFGHARVGGGLGLTSTGQALGTPHYAAPEVLVGRKDALDARADVYSLGATLYEALTGRHLHDTEDYVELVRRVLDPHARPVPVRRLAPSVEPALERIVMQAVEKRPEDRHADAAALRDELLAYAEGRLEDVRSGPVSPSAHALRATRGFLRRRAPALAAVLLALLGAGWWWTQRPATFLVESDPAGARVLVAGVDRGATPLELSLPPGRYEVTLRQEGFTPQTATVDLRAGLEKHDRFALRIHDEHDLDARDVLFRHLSVPCAVLPAPSEARTRSGAEVTPLWPRGAVRLEDLDEFALEAPGFPEGGALEFVRGADEVLASLPFEPADPFVRGPVPEAVRSALRVGDEVRWGWRPRGTRAGPLPRETSTRFRVVASEADATIAAALERAQEQPASVLAELRLRLLAQAELPTAMLRAVESLPAAARGDARVLALAQQAYDGLGLSDSERSRDNRKRIEALPADVLARVFSPAAPPR